MKLPLFILLLLCSCSNPITPTEQYCIEYHIGGTWSRGEVEFVNGMVTIDNWNLSVTSTPDNQTRLFRDTTVQTVLGEVYRSSTFLFPNGQQSNTIQGKYISHSKGVVCDTYDTLDVVVIRVPCNNSSGESWH